MSIILQEWESIIIFCLAVVSIFLVSSKVRYSRKEYIEKLNKEYTDIEREYNDLIAEEGVIYDTQLKYNKRLQELFSLYEITKAMSTSLRFSDIFKVLADYLHKRFLFKKVSLILIKDEEFSVSDIVYETEGLQDYSLRQKGIFPSLAISTRPLNEEDKKLCELLKNEVKTLQIIKTQWRQHPYIQYLPRDCQTYMAVPMIIEDRLMGILAIEDLSASEQEKFLILAAQFALEMRRIVLYERVEEMAITDGLTKAFAKRHILERLKEELERSLRHNFNLAFIMIDIDHFKNCNDIYGHLVGDVVLKDIVILLKNNTREVDLVGRFGGEEFCVILPETGKDEAMLVAERLREVIRRYNFKAYDEFIKVTVSIGVAVYPEDAKDMDSLLESSDKALYKAKNEGRDKVCVF